MAKTQAVNICILCFLACCRAFGQGDLATGPCYEQTQVCREAKESKQRAKLKQVYNSQIGVKEQGGANRGKMVEQYLAVTGLGPGYAWCSAFVSWCFVQSGIEAPRSAWVPAFAVKQNMIYQRGKGMKRVPKQGDVFMIWYDRLGRPAHIGFIDRWGNDYVITVEGNTNDDGSREGDGVYKKRRLTRQVWAVSDFIGYAP